MKNLRKLVLLAAMMMLGAFICVQGVSAKTLTGWQTIDGYTYYYNSDGTVTTGWQKLNNKRYYFRKKAEGDAPKGSMVTGFYTISSRTYYFDENGVRQKGWQTIDGDIYYFGTTSPLGAMYIGRQQIGDYYYYFGTDGKLQTGWVTENGKKYYYKKAGKIGTVGRGVTGWVKIGNYYYYFNKKGVMQHDKWINSKYYVDSNGRRLVSTITPDGYLVDSKGLKGELASGWIEIDGDYYYYKSGEKVTGWLKLSGKYYYLDENGVRQTGWLTIGSKTYYLNASGVRQTGWVTIDSKRYYFNSNGVLQKNTTVDGVTLDENGVASTARVLLVAGHGQGDNGASAKINGTTYYEADLTRELATLVYNALTSSGEDISVTMYDQNYNLYTTNYNLTYKGSTTSPTVTWTDYDYVLEIHFNALVTADLSGNGSYTGTAMLVHSTKTDTTVDKAIISSITGLGFKTWNSGLVRYSNLLNMNLCNAAGVSYGLLETAFINDKDDMTFYLNNKSSIAKAIADGLLTGLGY
ncbi:MAG: N-acetylmuramoyl-L-alanine amidase [Lachnospiraceae bacterium]|nr:N-acetylmuramoyl-L-alanine amidase [Lachnospiraceae bacterium]